MNRDVVSSQLQKLTDDELRLAATTKSADYREEALALVWEELRRRGIADRPSVRAEIWAYRRRSPFLPWTGLDPLSLPGIATRRAELAYQLVDWFNARGFRQQHWADVGRKHLLER